MQELIVLMLSAERIKTCTILPIRKPSHSTDDSYRQYIFTLGWPTLGRGYSPHSSTALDRQYYLLPVKTHASITLTQRTEFGYNYKLCWRYRCIFTKSESCMWQYSW